jgi:EmrB/QacA subfamily drug resistance transporter
VAAAPALATPATTPAEPLRFSSTGGRWVLLASILGSGMAGIDATVVNVALPAIGRDLHTDFAALQWTVTAYSLALASLILLGGSLGDRFGRRRVFVIGVTWFATASLLCGLAPNASLLIGARALQGIGGALLTPGSLAMIQSSFAPEDRGRAIGAWSGLGGVATAIGPFVGGYLVESVSWRFVFLINAPLAVVVVLVAIRHVPETRDPSATGRVDVVGAALGALGLAGVTYALIEAPARGGGSPSVLASAAVGILALAAFLVVEAREHSPMLPLGIFRSTQFSAANAVTFVVYGAFGGVLFLLVLQLQVVGGFSPIVAGTALLPVTAIMLLFSARSGQLAARIGPRLQMSVGPAIVAVALLLMLRIGSGASYVGDVLPAVLVLGAGLATMVAPLTATALAAVDDQHAGIASGVNNAVARAAGLIAVAVLPAVAGLTGNVFSDPPAFAHGFRIAVLVCVVLLVGGSLLAAALIRNDVLAAGGGGNAGGDEGHALLHCAMGAPPLIVRSTSEAPCRHLPELDLGTAARADGCETCLTEGTSWVSLRICQSCGRIGCCDSSPQQHATGHADDSAHPVIRSFEPDENWFYCYPEGLLFEVEDAPPAPSHS